MANKIEVTKRKSSWRKSNEVLRPGLDVIIYDKMYGVIVAEKENQLYVVSTDNGDKIVHISNILV